MNIILFGFKGSGKTHFGKLLAAQTGRTFIDTDQLLGNGSTAQLHAVIGETKFRELEAQAIRSLQGVDHAVIALGGGAVIDPSNREFLQQIGLLVYLKASFEKVKQRILGIGFPSFAPSLEELERVYQERIPLYESIKAPSIDTDVWSEPTVVAELEAIIELGDSSDGF